jgi:alpha-beta hydrolase superfamily lysophospholipase
MSCRGGDESMRHEALYLETSGGRRYWQTWRPDQAPRAAVVLIHGQGDHGRRYAHLGEALVQAGFSLSAIDVRGNGRSDGRRGDTPSYAALLDDVSLALRMAEHLDADCRRFLFGHSMGGQLVANYVIRRAPALSGVILSSPWLRLALSLPRWKVAFGRALARIYPTYTFSNTLTSGQLSHDAAFRESLDPDHLAHGRITARLAAALIDSGEEALADAARFTLPLLLMQAGLDNVVDPRATARFAEQVGAADCTYRLYPESRHELLHDVSRDQVMADLIAWLSARV